MGAKVIISGGGTGGHIFPAISIANAIKRLDPQAEILFVGAKGRMEMEKVPLAGYKIIGLDIQGFNRQSIWKNWSLPFKLMKSLGEARKIIRDFKPDVAVGVGGYASGPLLIAASQLGIPYIIQEQNSYAGLTNKNLGKKAEKICVAFEGMEKFFPSDRILFTGNPIRKEVVQIEDKKAEASEAFNLDAGKPTILITGGSLGAKTLNQSVLKSLKELHASGTQIIWQCGSLYYDSIQEALQSEKDELDFVRLFPFIQNMDLAYSMADLIISRAGAGTIAELCAIGKATILVPSPNVAEDHQTQNALALVNKKAAVLVKDQDAIEDLIPTALNLIQNAQMLKELGVEIEKLAKYNADEVIANEVLKLVK